MKIKLTALSKGVELRFAHATFDLKMVMPVEDAEVFAVKILAATVKARRL